MMDLAHFLDSLAAENGTETVMTMRQPGSVTDLAESIVVAVVAVAAAAAAVAAEFAAAVMYLHRTCPIVLMLI